MSEAPTTQEPGQAADPGRPGRYQRSAGGLIGALVILLAFVAAFVAFRAVTRSDLEVRPEAVDYLAVVGDAQAAGLEVVYPPTLPDGWMATSVDLRPAVEETWGISMLTGDGTFVGVRQVGDDLDEVLDTYVDEDAVEGDPVDLDGEVADRWRVFSDEGGDTAYAAQAGPRDAWVLVYGSAAPEQIARIAESLTRAPV